MGAELTGAVWGDHASPISDTTILGATGVVTLAVTGLAAWVAYRVWGPCVDAADVPGRSALETA